MSGGFPINLELCNATSVNGSAAQYSEGAASGSTPSATANTKGSWTQLVAATTIDADFIEIIMSAQQYVVGFTYAFDIGIGASGSEIVLFPNLIWAVLGQYSWSSARYMIPCSIPAGTRISVRCQGDVASGGGAQVSCRLYQSSMQSQYGGGGGIDALGFNSATTNGTTITPVLGSYGSWVQIVASTARDYSGFIIGPDTAGGNGERWVIDIGIGASGSEQVILPYFYWWGTIVGVSSPYMIPIPAGSRIAVRASDVGNGPAANMDITIYGIYQ